MKDTPFFADDPSGGFLPLLKERWCLGWERVEGSQWSTWHYRALLTLSSGRSVFVDVVCDFSVPTWIMRDICVECKLSRIYPGWRPQQHHLLIEGSSRREHVPVEDCAPVCKKVLDEALSDVQERMKRLGVRWAPSADPLPPMWSMQTSERMNPGDNDPDVLMGLLEDVWRGPRWSPCEVTMGEEMALTSSLVVNNQTLALKLALSKHPIEGSGGQARLTLSTAVTPASGKAPMLLLERTVALPRSPSPNWDASYKAVKRLQAALDELGLTWQGKPIG